MFKSNFNILNKINKFELLGGGKNKKLFSSKENIFSYLNERNLVSNISHRELLDGSSDVEKHLGKNPKLYIGFDPTAESLHLGNLIGILTAVRFSGFGIQPVFVMGGATGQIGDPSGKCKERPLMHRERIQNNLSMIEENLKDIITNIKQFSDVKSFCKYKSEFKKKINLRDKDFNSSGIEDDEKSLIEFNFKKINYGFKQFISPDEHFYNSMLTANLDSKLLKNFFSREEIDYKIVNNMDFYKDLNIIDFLREAGINLRMGQLLSRETVKNRLDSKEGLSLAEFMYQTFQGYDFLKLNENYGVNIQIGGSDQWGNMLAGYELIKKIKNLEVTTMTFPLMTTSNGKKFGKSEGNAIFLNPKFSPINSIYQYFYNLADSDLSNMLKAFTFIENEEINDIVRSHNKSPEKRNGQKILAEKVVGMLFSDEEAQKCLNNCQAHYMNFSNLDFCSPVVNHNQVEDMLKNCQITNICLDSLENYTLSKLCLDHKILPTKAQFKRLIESGGIKMNDNKLNEDVIIDDAKLIAGKYLILKTGKKNTHILQINKKEIYSQDQTNSSSISLA